MSYDFVDFYSCRYIIGIFPAAAEDLYYTVKSGDTLWK
jgi:hypothetical protein